MFQTFSKTLQSAVELADEQARAFGQEYVATEHLLLGVIAVGDGDAVRTLKGAVDLPKFESLLNKSLPRGATPTGVTGRLSLSPNAKQAMSAAAGHARQDDAKNISTRLVLLSLLKDKESAIGEALRRSGADFDELCAALEKKPAQPEE